MRPDDGNNEAGSFIFGLRCEVKKMQPYENSARTIDNVQPYMFPYSFRYCINCGTPLEERLLPSEDRPRLFCAQCGYIHYLNPKVVSGTLPVADGKIWLLRRGIEPRLGYWTYPAGFQEWDESTEEAAIRETREELGCEVALDGLLGVYSRAGAPIVNVVYLAHLTHSSTPPHPTTEALEVRAFLPGDIPWSELAFPSTSQVLKDWLASISADQA